MTTQLNPLASLKEIGAIEYRINDAGLNPDIKVSIIARGLANLFDTTPPKFYNIIRRCSKALDDRDYLELAAGLALLRSMIPLTYGIIPAGTLYHLPGEDVLWKKSKSGKVSVLSGVLYPHPAADTRVCLVND